MTPPTHDELKRALAPRHVSMIAIGGIIGAGLFVGSGASIATAGPAACISYLLGGALVLLVMRMLGEMAAAHPQAGSFADFARIGLGEWAGFVSGWLYWYFWVVVVAVEAVAGAAILHGWAPALPAPAVGAALVAGLTALNLASTRSYGEAEFWLSAVKVGAIVLFIAMAGAYALGLAAPHGPTFALLTADGGFAPMGAGPVLATVITAVFCLTGAEIATVAAAETHGSERVMARMSLTISVRILVFYVLAIFLIPCVVPWREIHPGVSPFATALQRMGAGWAAWAMSAVVLLAVVSCLNSGLYVTSRILFGLARHGGAPQALTRLDRRGVPTRAILLGSLFSYGALAVSIASPQGVFIFLVNASGALMIVIYMIVAVAQLRLRFQSEREGRRPALAMWAHPWGSLATLAAMVAILGAMALTTGLRIQLLASLLAVAAAGGAYAVVRRRKAQAASRLAPPA